MGLLYMLLLACPLLAQWPEAQPNPPQPAPQAQNEPFVFKTGVTWVRVDAQVWNGKQPVSGLSKDDFVITDEGQPQPILYFGHETEPLDVLLLLDVSGSMHRYLQQMAATAKEALNQLHSEDRVGIMVFARTTEVDEPLTSDRARVERDLKQAVQHQRSLGGGTQINAALIDAAEYMDKNSAQPDNAPPRPGRRGILIVTDNMGLNYRIPDEKVLDSLLGADCVLNAIVVGRGERPAPPKPGEYVNPDFTPPDVFRLSEETGGVAIKTEKAGEGFAFMMDSMRSRYSLQYRAPEGAGAGSFRRIEVDLSPEARKRYPRAVVRARSGYRATG